MNPQRKKRKPSEPRSLLSQAHELGWIQVKKRQKSRVQVQDLQETIYSDDSSDQDFPPQQLPELIDSPSQTSRPLNWNTSQDNDNLSSEIEQESNDIEVVVHENNGQFLLTFDSFELLQKNVLILAKKYNLKCDYNDTKRDSKSCTYLTRFTCHNGPQKCILTAEKKIETGNIEFRLNAKLNLQHPIGMNTSTKTINKVREKLIHLKNIKKEDIDDMQNTKLSDQSYTKKKENQKTKRKNIRRNKMSLQSLKENFTEELSYFIDRLTQKQGRLYESLIDMSKEYFMFLEDTDLSEE